MYSYNLYLLLKYEIEGRIRKWTIGLLGQSVFIVNLSRDDVCQYVHQTFLIHLTLVNINITINIS